MSIPLHDMPELRATFASDAGTLIQVAEGQLAALVEPAADLSLTAALRTTFHSLRGAAAMVGAKQLTALIDDCERLVEVAESFKLTARDKAVEVFAFLKQRIERLRAAVQATLAGRLAEASQCYEVIHREITGVWGGYFYPPASETADDASTKSDGKPVTKTDRPLKPRKRNDRDAIAREFLNSLGVAAGETSARAAGAAPAPAEQIDPEMLSYFVLETSESLTQLERLLLAWEKSPTDAKVAYSIFRLVHTIKGAANSLGLSRIGKLLHGLEDLLETHVVDRVYPRVSELVEIIFGVADSIKAFVREAQTGQPDPANANRAVGLGQRVQALASLPPPPSRETAPALPAAPKVAASVTFVTSGEAPVPAAETAVPTPIETPVVPVEVEPEATQDIPEPKPEIAERAEVLDTQTIRVDSNRLDLLMNLIGELVISRSRLEKKLADISRLKEEMSFGKSRLFQAIADFQNKYEYSRPEYERNRLAGGDGGARAPIVSSPRGATPGAEDLGGFSELEFDQYDDFNILARTLMEIGTDTDEIFSQLNRFFDAFGEETGQFSKITARLQDEITRVRMMPLTLLFQRLQRSARDAARKEDKAIDFTTDDQDTRLDKLILDQLYTPLLHIVRNAVSHGIEPSDARATAGKPTAGQLRIRAACEANHVIIEIADDGSGLNLAAIRATAIQRGLILPDSVVDDEALTQFIFHPGFSTAENVTDVSGRGVGLDVVRQEIARLSGSVHVRSVAGQGCTFVIHLPLTLAINQAMFITAGNATCALPLNFVERIQENQTSEVAMSGQQELVRTPEGMVPLVRLHRLLNLPSPNGGGAIVLARVADRRVAIGVDRILRKQDIVVKPLGPLLRQHPLFSGATLGGDGQVVMIVDLPRVLENEHATGLVGGPIESVPAAEPDSAAHPTILVVDDSLSVRKVIEKHLHSYQFRVELAVDGLDALERLRTRHISLVLTDLEMPRMHGFELIAEMRRHEALRSLPVIVVTSRDADKHRRRAAALGANDYIIKPFSREQLAEHINRLLAKSTRQ